MKFRKRPAVIEAVQIAAEWFDGDHPNPLHPRGVIMDPKKRCVEIPTLEGVMTGQIGDWLITGVSGERYPCKPDIFAKTYEPVGRPPAERRGNEKMSKVRSRYDGWSTSY